MGVGGCWIKKAGEVLHVDGRLSPDPHKESG